MSFRVVLARPRGTEPLQFEGGRTKLTVDQRSANFMNGVEDLGPTSFQAMPAYASLEHDPELVEIFR